MFIGAVMAFSLFSCDASKKKELELKEKELELKERELNRKDSLLRTTTEPAGTERPAGKEIVTRDPSLSNINNLLGTWKDRKNKEKTMQFYRNGDFRFVDLNGDLGQYEELTGKYTLENGKLTLMYDDRAKQTFGFVKVNNGVAEYYIKKPGYLMEKE